MDKEKAKLLLRSFRPDGADAGNESFAEALQLATVDRELGDWLAHERAEDAKFANALSELAIPENLRSDILTLLEYDGAPLENDELHSVFVGAMGSISVPHGLRDEIVAAMELESKIVVMDTVDTQQAAESGIWRRLSVAALAAVAAVVVFLNVKPAGDVAKPVQIAVGDATHELMNSLHETQNIKLVATNVSTDEGINWLRDADLPVPERVPNGLMDAKFLGCKDIKLSCGRPASLLCFEKSGTGLVYLIVLRIDDLTDSGCLQEMENVNIRTCNSCPVTKFNVVRWREDNNAYFLLTKANRDEVAELF